MNQPTLFDLPDDGEKKESELPRHEPDLQVFTVVPRGNFVNDLYEIGRAWKHNRCVWVRLHALPTNASILICSPSKAQKIIEEMNRKAKS